MKKTKNQKAIDRRIGELLLEYRIQADMTIADVVSKLDISIGQYHGYEKGTSTVPLARLIDIAGIYGISVWDILEPVIGVEDTPETPQQRRMINLLLSLSPSFLTPLEGIMKGLAGKK